MKWFRFYSETLHDVKVQSLPPALFKAWVNLLCLAAEYNGRIPKSGLAVGYQLRVPSARAGAILTALIEAGLLEDDPESGDLRPHNWNGRQFKSDNVTERVRKHRGNVSRNDTATPRARSEAEAETETEAETEAEAEGAGALLALLVTAHENTLGTVNASREAILRDWAARIPDNEIGEASVEYAFRQAALQGRPSLSYVEAIFKRLETDGWPREMETEHGRTAKAKQGRHGERTPEEVRADPANVAAVERFLANRGRA